MQVKKDTRVEKWIETNDISTTTNITTTGTVTGGHLKDSSLSLGHVVVSGTDGVLSQDDDITFSVDTLTVDNVTSSGTVTGGHLKDTSLTSGRVPLVTTGGQLKDGIGITYTDMVDSQVELDVFGKIAITNEDGGAVNLLENGNELEVISSVNDVNLLLSSTATNKSAYFTLKGKIENYIGIIFQSTTYPDTNYHIGCLGDKGINIYHGEWSANQRFQLSETDKCNIGDIRGGDYSQFEADGTLVFVGDATVWDDLRVVPGSFDRPGVSDPDIVAYDVNGGGINTYLWEFAKNDIASFTVQLPHSYKTGTNIYAHIHWTPGSRGSAENGATVGWKIDYSWANIDGNFGTMATLDLSDACDGTNHKHQMTPEVSITGTSKGISSMLICNIKRTDTGTDDTWASTTTGQLPMLLEIDFHFEIDTVGSRQQSAK